MSPADTIVSDTRTIKFSESYEFLGIGHMLDIYPLLECYEKIRHIDLDRFLEFCEVFGECLLYFDVHTDAKNVEREVVSSSSVSLMRIPRSISSISSG
jgi:hypothetical protein